MRGVVVVEGSSRHGGGKIRAMFWREIILKRGAVYIIFVPRNLYTNDVPGKARVN